MSPLEFEESMKNNPCTAPQDMLARGGSIYYADDRYPDPDILISEDPDGAKTVVKFINNVFQDIGYL